MYSKMNHDYIMKGVYLKSNGKIITLEGELWKVLVLFLTQSETLM